MNTSYMTIGQLDAAFRGEGKSLFISSCQDGSNELVKLTNVLRSYTGVLALPVMSLSVRGEDGLIAKVDFPAAALGKLSEKTEEIS